MYSHTMQCNMSTYKIKKKMGGSDDEGVITKYNRYGKSEN